MQEWVIGIDLGGTKIELGLVDPANRIAARRRIATQPQLGPESVTQRIAAEAEALAAMLPAGAAIGGVGICSPGPVDHLSGALLDPPNLQGLHHSALGPMLAERLGLPVALEHDAKAAALGDFHFGAGRDAGSMVFIVAGTGVGAAVIVDGQLFRGEHNAAGEIGHTTLDRHGELCSCGRRGCVETFISGPWLSRRYRAAALAAGSPDPGDAPGEHVAALARSGDGAALEVLRTAGEALGQAVATMAMLLNVDLYVVGGSVAKCGDLLLASARAAVPRHAFRSVSERVRIVPTALGDDGPILGCAWLARNHGKSR